MASSLPQAITDLILNSARGIHQEALVAGEANWSCFDLRWNDRRSGEASRAGLLKRINNRLFNYGYYVYYGESPGAKQRFTFWVVDPEGTHHAFC